MNKYTTKKTFDTVIIGGGIAGLYCASKLNALDPKCKIAVLESTGRFGGRIKTHREDDVFFPIEMGCMRYLKSQKYTTELIEKDLRLDIRPFDTGNPQEHIYHLRNKVTKANAWSLPYAINKEKIKKGPFTLLSDLTQDIITLNKSNLFEAGLADSKTQWDKIKNTLVFPFEGPSKGVKLSDIGFANLLADCLGHEGKRMLEGSGEYYAKTLNWNAAEALPYSHLLGYRDKKDMSYWCVKNGFETIIEALVKSLSRFSGIDLLKSHMVSSVKKNKDIYTVIVRTPGKIICINTPRIIFAIPKQAILKINWLDEMEDIPYCTSFASTLRSVKDIASLRFAATYDSPWWRKEFSGLNGHMVTDLPIRHGYYFGSPNKNKQSLFLSTIDMQETDYWIPLLKRGSPPEKLLPALGIAPQILKYEISKQLEMVHNKTDIPPPNKIYYACWNTLEHEAGFHAWGPQSDLNATMNYMLSPFDEKIHFIGEAFSDQQGWIEGALSTTEALINKIK